MRSIYEMLVDIAAILRDTRGTKGEIILRARQELDEVLALVQEGNSIGEVYIPGCSVVINDDDGED